MTPLSSNEAAKQRQLANLKQGGNPTPANTFARSHGGYAEIARERVDARVAVLLEALAEDAPLRAADGSLPREDTAVVHMLATVLCRLETIETYLTMNGLLDAKGNVRPAAELARRMRREAFDLFDAMGMSPRSRAKLGLDLADAAGKAPDLAAAMAGRPQEGGERG